MKQRLKVLHLCDSLSVGGAERLILSMVERMDRSRFEFHVCSLKVIRNDFLRPDFERIGVPLYSVNAKRFYDIRTFQNVARYIREHNIDIVHTQLTSADIVGRIVGKMTGRPVISTLQNEPQDYNRERFDRRWLEQLTIQLCKPYLVAVSHRIREMFIQEWQIPADSIAMIYNAVPMEQYLQVPEGTPEREGSVGPIITNIGRLSPQKAQHHLLETARIVLEQRPEVRFMIVGQGRLEGELKAQAQVLGISNKVTFTGPRKDIPDILAQTDIFVLSSLWEGLPLTAIEAMASARAVVLTDVGGNRELVETSSNGLIVPPGDVSALANALLTLVNDAQCRVAFGKAARARVRVDFSIETITRQYEVLYETIAQRQRRPIAELFRS
ncbi:MAG: glycosyltransferase [Roseiflexaceae bacterium]|nr:glycosyltransferase [Roseiflexaceae bacterium]